MIKQQFHFMKECLVEMDYPNIHGLSDKEIGGIFDKQNRCFLVDWLLRQYDKEFEETLDNNGQNPDFLASVICEQGFCTDKQKKAFMEGSLDLPLQVDILYRMFKQIKESLSFSEVGDASNVVTINDLTSLRKANLNLFPMYGKLRLFSQQEKHERELKPLQEANKEMNASEDVVFVNISAKQASLQDLKVKVPLLTSLVDKLNDENTMPESCIRFPEEQGDMLKKTFQKAKMLSEYMQHLNVIQEFEGHQRLLPVTDLPHEELNMLGTLTKQLMKCKRQ